MQVNMRIYTSLKILPEQDLTDKHIALLIGFNFLHYIFILYKLPPFETDLLSLSRQHTRVLDLKFHCGE